ncbi:hypothetical protein [Actinomadura luteofluorescens]|uniref:hypothetical protein n=1 Tax=Actinomadura luteofluorescens TaxID=46163 RepID=UPI0030D204A5
MGNRESYGTISYSDHLYRDSFGLVPQRGETITVKRVAGRVCNWGSGTVIIEEVVRNGALLNPGGGTVVIGKVTGRGLVRNWNGSGPGASTAGTITIGKVTGRGRVHNSGNGTVTIDELAGDGYFENVSGDDTVTVDEVTGEAWVTERKYHRFPLENGGTGLVKKAKGRSQIVGAGGTVKIDEFLGKAGVLLHLGVAVLPASAAGRVSAWSGSDLKPGTVDGTVGGTVSAVVGAAEDLGGEHQRRYLYRRPAEFRWLVG